jgi:hypothetical protein
VDIALLSPVVTTEASKDSTLSSSNTFKTKILLCKFLLECLTLFRPNYLTFRHLTGLTDQTILLDISALIVEIAPSMTRMKVTAALVKQLP